MLTPLETIEIESGDAPTVSIIWMHGLGADGHDFVPIVGELDLPPRPNVRFVFPHAPLRPVTINNGYVMRAWYDVLTTGFNNREDESSLRASQAAVEALIAAETERGIAPERVFLAGFSQGGAMALQTGLRHPRRLAGLIALSTYLPLAATLAAEAHPANAGVPIFMAHGTHDPVIPLRLSLTSHEQLKAAGYPVQWQSYPMPHTVCMELLRDLSAWLGERLAPL
ncbi:MAG: alpha/beta hydrolase [Pseudomonadota bacterium]